MKKIGFIICFVIFTLNVLGQQTGANQATSLCGGRWEFFMSSVAVKVTFKIDKYTGDVFVLVQRADKTLSWELVKREVRYNTDIQKQDAINYQLFTSGQGIKYTFLLNTNSGLVWQLVSGANGAFYFQAVE